MSNLAKYLYLFLDGVGLGEASDHNPLAGISGKPSLPFLESLLGGKLIAGLQVSQPRLLLQPIDATLGVPGKPQSATGQTSLFTGRNAPQFLGKHLSGFANGSLRILIEENGMFRQVRELGGTATAANVYSPGYFEAIEQRKIRYSVGALLNLTSGTPFRMPQDYLNGEALFWDITGRRLQERGEQVELLTPAQAGANLARLAGKYNLTLFECYLTDFAGHSQDINFAAETLREVDQFIAAILEHLAADVTLIVASDHGNLEDLSIKSHTLNPVPLLVVGQQAPRFATVTDITQIVSVILASDSNLQ